MKTCKCCGLENVGTGAVHPRCSKEGERRLAKDSCVKCGDTASSVSAFCGSCTVDSPCRNYPGGLS